MNRRDLLEMGLTFLVGSGLMILAQKKIEGEFRNGICSGYTAIMDIMKPIAESLGTLEQRPAQDIEQPGVYLVDSRKY
ncbi:hypothetical protein HYV88_00765 [Candidatus Woesearchaeota archaeon]|nr:hypothetical protein [Candidatus Woesearchaeota archaeon]